MSNSQKQELKLKENIILKVQSKIDVLNYLKYGLKIHPVSKFKNELIELELLEDDGFEGNHIEFIVRLVIKEFSLYGLDTENIRKSARGNFSQRGQYTLAKKVMHILIRNNLNLTFAKIAKYFNRTRQVIYYSLEEYDKALKSSTKKYNRMVQMVEKLNPKIKTYINK